MPLINKALVSVQEAVDYVFKTALTERTADEIRVIELIINGVSEAVETYLDYKFITREITEKTQGKPGWISKLYLQSPILSVSSIKEGGVSLSSTDYYIYEQFLLRSNGQTWSSLPQSIDITYKVGRCATTDAVPAEIKMAALIWIYELWHTGPANLTNVLGQGGFVLRPLAMPAQVQTFINRYRIKRV